MIDLPLSDRSLMAIFAHPDDESIACGGLLARCAQRGARVTLVCATHGENRSGVRDETWFTLRAEELSDAARVLGIAEVVLFDYADGFLPWAKPQELEARLVAEMRRIRPDVVITFGRDGLYWHPDHIAIHQRTTAAVESLGADAPALYYVTMAPGLMRKVVDEYASDGSGAAKLLGVTDPDAFGVSAERPTLVVEVGACATLKLAALKCHRTQTANGVLHRIPQHEAERMLGVEHFHRAGVGSTAACFIEEL